MKKVIYLSLILALVSLASFAQPKIENPYQQMMDSVFINTDTLKVEWVWAHIDINLPTNENVKDYGGGYYTLKTPHEFSLILKTNADRTKGIIANYHPFITFTTIYDVFEDNRSIVLYYKDKRTYYGMVYNKKIKACDRFAKKKREWKRFRKDFE